jgi:hypothetical protein
VNDEDPADSASEAEVTADKIEKPLEESSAQEVVAQANAPGPGIAPSTAPGSKADDSNKAAADVAGQKLATDPVAADLNDKLELEVKETVKVRKKIGSEIATVSELTPQTYNFTVEDKAEFLIYDAAAVRIKFGGRDVGDLGAKGRVRKLVFVSEKQDKKLQ